MNPQVSTLFDSYKSRLQNFSNIPLLKKIEELTNTIFKTEAFYEDARYLLGQDDASVQRVLNAAIESNFEGVTEYSDQFYSLYKVAMQKQELVRGFIGLALQKLDHGFSAFDAILISQALKISALYDTYYLAWIKAMRNSDAASKILQMQKDSPEELKAFIKAGGLDNNYTVITLNNQHNFVDVPYAVYFKEHVPKISTALDGAAVALQATGNLSDQQAKYVGYLKHYALCMREPDKNSLDSVWRRLDEIWMAIKYPIQLVHDIEYGYADPLRTKIIPDFSFRFVDDTYHTENEFISKVKDVMVAFFTNRNTSIGNEGLLALNNSFAALYYIPFHTGITYHFRMSGQSIPNRNEVKREKGVKIYFDPVSTAMRMKHVKKLVKQVFENTSLADRVNALDVITKHISSHEFGHAIYNLEYAKECISSETMSLLEEPRADLTALTTMLLMYRENILDMATLKEALFNFAASDLRRFVMYENVATKAYTISAVNSYKVYEQTGYMQLVEDKIRLDDTKAMEVLETLEKQFLAILDAEDAQDGAKLEDTLINMQKECALVKWLVKVLYKS